MGLCMRIRGNDELGIIKFFMKLAMCWPDNLGKWWNDLLFFSYVIPFATTTSLVAVYIVTEAKTEDPITLLNIFADMIGMAGFSIKSFHIRKNAQKIFVLDDILSKMKSMEKGGETVTMRFPRFVWTSCYAFFGQCVMSAGISIFNCWVPVESRQLSVKMPPYLASFDFIFYPMAYAWAYGHIGVFFANTATEALLICLTHTIREKSATLDRIIKDFEKVTDPKQRDEGLKNIIVYHQLLCGLHAESENLCSRPMLIQVFFLVVAIGTPSLRLLLTSGITLDHIVFMVCYLFWVASLLTIYFLVSDAATTAAGGIANSAYFAYRPGMTRDQVRKLVVLMGKAQRPLHFTARGIIKINRRVMLKLIKRSYSIYSAILNLK